jgi:hypothetical protein
MSRVFIIYEHRLFHDILVNALSGHSVVGALGRPAAPLDSIIDALNSTHANVVVLEGSADGNMAWHIVLAGKEQRRVITLNMERGVAQDYFTRTTAIDTLSELSLFLDDTNPHPRSR